MLTDYDVVGATLVASPDELPLRLRPIVRLRSDPTQYALVYDDTEGENERLLPEDAAYIAEQAAARRFHLYEVPFPALADHWLVQLQQGEPPEYLPRAAMQQRIEEVGWAALRASAAALGRNDFAAARSAAAYAARALDDAVPRLVLIALLRSHATESQIWLLSQPLKGVSPEVVRTQFACAWADVTLRPATTQILADPLAATYRLTEIA